MWAGMVYGLIIPGVSDPGNRQGAWFGPNDVRPSWICEYE
jgi:hypothetical protein